MKIRLRAPEAKLYRRTMRTRFPFRFGKANMTEMQIFYLRVPLESESGASFPGVSASGIPPLWFDKRPGKTPRDNETDLRRSLSEAVEAYEDAGPGSAWDLHRAVTEPLRRRLAAEDMAPLAAGFGAALVEAAVVDGLCRLRGQSFSTALRGGALGLSPVDSAQLPEKPLSHIKLRHTVGLADALSAPDVRDPLHDGLPETLEEVVRTHRPAFFKIKISGDAAESLPRLRRIAEILDREAGNYSSTLDGNEQFPDMDAFAAFLDRLWNETAMKGFLKRILWIEQPVARDSALEPRSAPALAKVSAFKPVIIDESDDEGDALERALALGYAGVSSKLCKGLFRSVSHFLRLRRAAQSGGNYLILSSEDLTTVPVHPLQQDLALAAALGITHSERNGHHYIRGFAFLSPAERQDALAHYPSLYEPDAQAGAKVRVENGGFRLDEVNAAPGFGSSSWPDWSALESIELFPSKSLALGGSR